MLESQAQPFDREPLILASLISHVLRLFALLFVNSSHANHRWCHTTIQSFPQSFAPWRVRTRDLEVYNLFLIGSRWLALFRCYQPILSFTSKAQKRFRTTRVALFPKRIWRQNLVWNSSARVGECSQMVGCTKQHATANPTLYSRHQ